MLSAPQEVVTAPVLSLIRSYSSRHCEQRPHISSHNSKVLAPEISCDSHLCSGTGAGLQGEPLKGGLVTIILVKGWRWPLFKKLYCSYKTLSYCWGTETML